LNDLNQEQKKLIPEAVQKAITAKSQVLAGDMVLVISQDAHVTANLHVPQGTEEATMSKLQSGANVAGDVEKRLQQDLKGIAKVDASKINVYTSYLKRAPLRKFYSTKVVLNMVVDDLPTGNDAPENSDVEKALKAAIVSKGQLDAKKVTVSLDNDFATNGKATATISVTGSGHNAEQYKTQLQSRFGGDLASSLEDKLKGISKLKGKTLAVYTSPLKVENVPGLAMDLSVEGVDFKRLDAVPALLVSVVNKMQDTIKTESSKAADCTTTKDDIALFFPQDMTSDSISVRAEITKPDDEKCDATKMMAELQGIAKELECDLECMAAQGDKELKYFVTSSAEAISVTTPDQAHDKTACDMTKC